MRGPNFAPWQAIAFIPCDFVIVLCISRLLYEFMLFCCFCLSKDIAMQVICEFRAFNLVVVRPVPLLGISKYI